MSFNQARQFIAKSGVPLSPLMDSMETPAAASRQEVEQMFAEGYAEMEAYGHSQKYYTAIAMMAKGMDDAPDLEAFNGAIPKTQAQLAADIVEARASSAQYLQRDRLPAALQDMHIGGQHISEVPVDILHDQMAMALADSQPGPGRDAISALMAHLDGAPATSMVSIAWEAPEAHMSFEVNSSSSIADQNDTFGRLRAPGLAADHGLEGLAIRPSVFPEHYLSGVVNFGGGGGEYSVADDYMYQQVLAESNGDYHQGDSTNVEHL